VAAERAIDIDTAVDLADAEARLAARAVRPVSFGDHAIGAGPVFVIAEAGVNHDGDPAVAHALIDAAATAGADAVKFQTFDPDALAAADAPKAAYQEAASAGGDQRRMLAALRLPDDVWAELQAHAIELGIGFFSTPFDPVSADLLERLDVPAFKVGSGELTNLGFLDDLARRGRSILLSTGMADMAEVAAAVDTVRAAGDPPLALFHCVSSYPAAAADANLRAIETMRRAFGVPVGWSDHTPGIETAIAAVAIGASLVEKHLTLDRARSGPDHRASLDPAAFASLVRAIRETEASLGDGEKRPVSSETEIAAVARRSLHWRADLAAGTVIGPGAFVALRPGIGLEPAREAALIGRRTAVDVRAGRMVQSADLQDAS
jgi:N-acetylneuraminate synthase/N,N'-diacetyllegionaminate synthase